MDILIKNIDAFTCMHYMDTNGKIEDKYLADALMSYVICHPKTEIKTYGNFTWEYTLIVDEVFRIQFIRKQNVKTKIYLTLLNYDKNIFLNCAYADKVKLLAEIN